MRRLPGESQQWRATTLEHLWREQLGAPAPGPSPDPAQPPRGWLLAAGLAAVLQPYADLPHRRGDLTGLRELDAPAARALLDRLPATELDQRQNSSPTLRTFLELIEIHPRIRGSGYVVGPDRADERVSLTGLLVDDPDLFAFVPDIAPGRVPDFVADLGALDQAHYLEHRTACLESGVSRQQWHLARHRYGIAGALSAPTEIQESGPFGDRRLRLWWT